MAAALVAVTAIELSASGGLDPWLLILLALIVGIFGPFESVARTLSDWQGTVTFDTRLNVEEAAKGAISALLKVAPGLSWTQIGITVFKVQRRPSHPVRGVQTRVVRVRMESSPRPSTVLWTWGKGILGECWREERDTHLDHRTFFAPYMNTSKKTWKALGDDVRRGLSFRDFIDIRDYGLVFASPMKDHHGYHGCFVVQVPSELGNEILTDDAQEVVHTFTAVTCAALCG